MKQNKRMKMESSYISSITSSTLSQSTIRDLALADDEEEEEEEEEEEGRVDFGLDGEMRTEGAAALKSIRVRWWTNEMNY